MYRAVFANQHTRFDLGTEVPFMPHTLARKYLRDKWPEFDEALDSLSIPARLQSSGDMQLLVLYGGFGFLPAASDHKFVRASELSQTSF